MAAAVPQVRVADVDFNTSVLVSAAQEAAEQGAEVMVFPELCITSASCADLFFQPRLQKAAVAALLRFAADTAALPLVSIVGLPLLVDERLYNVAAVVQGGKVLAMVPKSVLPSKRSGYEYRQFSAASALSRTEICLGDYSVPVGTDLVFEISDEFRFGVEIGDDAGSLLPPSTRLAMQGARVIFNPSASLALAGSHQYRQTLVAARSGSCVAAYVHAGAGVGESTQDGVCGGAAMIAVNGRMHAQNQPFARETNLVYADVDLQKLAAARLSESSFCENQPLAAWPAPRVVACAPVEQVCDLKYACLPSRPFVPCAEDCAQRCEEILNIQAAALAKRIECTSPAVFLFFFCSN